MTTRQRPRRRDETIKIVDGGTTYTFTIDGEVGVQVLQIDDAPPIFPVTGEQRIKERQDHNVLTVRAIRNAYGAQVDRRFETRGGVLDVLADSTMDTRHPDAIFFAPAENNPASPSAAGTSLFVRPNNSYAATTPNMNPKQPKFFQGTGGNIGVWVLRVDYTNSSNAEVEAERWSSSAWVNTLSGLMSPGVSLTTGGYDIEEFQGSLCFLFNNAGAERVYYTTDGSSSTAFGNHPSVNYGDGSRLKTFKNLLWLFAQDSGAVTVQAQTSPTGGSAWTTRSTNGLTGQLRDVEIFTDPEGTQRIFILMEHGLYYWDETNYVFIQVLALLNEGRSMIHVNIAGSDAMLLFLDNQRVHVYFANATTWDVSPGGSQGMPSGKDFGFSPKGQVCVTASAQYVYPLWSGFDTDGSVQKPLIMALNLNSVRLTSDGFVEAGWHYIWQKSDTSIEAASSYIFIDPATGDLIAGVQDATGESTTHVQLKKIEVHPDLQGTLNHQTTGFITLPREDFGGVLVSTHVLDSKAHTSGLGTSKSVKHSFRIDGATGSYTDIATITSDNVTVDLPDNASTALGTNSNDIQFQYTFAANAATDNMRYFDFDIGYRRSWPLRWSYMFDVIVKQGAGRGKTSAKDTIANLKSVLGIKTKILLTYADEASIPVVPLSRTQRQDVLGALASNVGAPITGRWRIVLGEA